MLQRDADDDVTTLVYDSSGARSDDLLKNCQPRAEMTARGVITP